MEKDITNKLTLAQLEEWLANKELGGIIRIVGQQLLDTMCENKRLREALIQILDDGQFIEFYKRDDTPNFTTNEKCFTDGGSFCGAAARQAIEALSYKESNNVG